MDSIDAEIERIDALTLDSIADSIQRIGFTCTDCGECCRSEPTEDHTALILPDEVREIIDDTNTTWDAVARPMPYGIEKDGTGETFEWALQTTSCGDCRFYDAELRETGGCQIYASRPALCRTYPFQLTDNRSDGTGGIVDQDGAVRASACEGLGQDIDRKSALELAQAVKERTLRELAEARRVLDLYQPVDHADELVVHDSEGAKTPTGEHMQR